MWEMKICSVNRIPPPPPHPDDDDDDDMTWYTESFSTFYQASVSRKAWLEIPARCDF